MTTLSLCLSSPQSPLFPYTTLFRSSGAHRPSRPDECQRRKRAVENPGRTPERRGVNPGFRPAQLVAGNDSKSVSNDLDSGADRKSTRLNSSHVAISYAVFCLTKKY